MIAVHWLLSGTATAAAVQDDCDGAHAPPAYYNEPCSGTNICEFSGAGLNTIDCWDLTGNDGDGAEVFAVEDYDNAGTRTFSIFGSVDGYDFCCYITDLGTPHQISIIILEGTDYADELNFSYTTRDVVHVDTFGRGNGGDDILLGSDDAGYDGVDVLTGDEGEDYLEGQDGWDGLCGYQCISGGGDAADIDEIHGGPGRDDIHGNGGVDTVYGENDGDWIYGDDGSDELHGGDGADEIYGGTGDDTCEGGDGDDYIDGQVGDDNISGYGGADELWGGNGNDEICSGDGTGDELHGGPSSGSSFGTNDDQLWAKASAVGPTGTVVGSSANCGDNGAGFGSWAGTSCGSSPCCTYNLSSYPAGCPGQ